MVWYRASSKFPQEISANVAAQQKDRHQERRRERHH